MRQGLLFADIDVAQVVLYIFFIFFGALILYLRREDKREGYPLESERSAYITHQGFPAIPSPKTFRLANGTTQTAPRREVDDRPLRAVPIEPWPGAPLVPTGNAMIDGVGPASYALRANVPDTTHEGHTRIAPLRVATTHTIDLRDPDPRGMKVIGADGLVAGTVSDAWVDRAEGLIRYLEVDLPGIASQAADGKLPVPRQVLLPINFTRINVTSREVKVQSILSTQFADVPALASPNQVTLREEDRICAYYGGGYLYATPSRQEPVL
jgi:photosynthetic reaction center H subunit